MLEAPGWRGSPPRDESKTGRSEVSPLAPLFPSLPLPQSQCEACSRNQPWRAPHSYRERLPLSPKELPARRICPRCSPCPSLIASSTPTGKGNRQLPSSRTGAFRAMRSAFNFCRLNSSALRSFARRSFTYASILTARRSAWLSGAGESSPTVIGLVILRLRSGRASLARIWHRARKRFVKGALKRREEVRTRRDQKSRGAPESDCRPNARHSQFQRRPRCMVEGATTP